MAGGNGAYVCPAHRQLKNALLNSRFFAGWLVGWRAGFLHCFLTLFCPAALSLCQTNDLNEINFDESLNRFK